MKQWIVGGLLCLVWTSAEAQTMPVGAEIEINDDAEPSNRTPAVAGDGAGGYTVVWESSMRIRGRLFPAQGVPSSELIISDPEGPAGFRPSVAQTPSGEFVVVWRTATDEVRAKTFDSTGTPISAEVVVADETPDQVRDPKVGMADNGDFVVVWNDFGSEQDVLFRRLDLSGGFLGEVTLANTLTAGPQGEADVAMGGLGDFVIVWTSQGSQGDDDSLTSIQGRLFASTGQPLADQFQVNTITDIRQDLPAVDISPNGEFAVVWADNSGVDDDDQRGIYLQRFDNVGQTLGSQIAVNTFTSGGQCFPDVAGLTTGEWMVTWDSRGSVGNDGLGDSIQGRLFDTSGQAVADQFQVNSYIPQSQIRPRVALGQGTEFLIVWESNGSSTGNQTGLSVLGQFFGPLTPEIFADDFESGDLSAWSQSAP